MVNETFGMELIEQIYLNINYQSRLYIQRVFKVFIRTEGVDRLLKSGTVNPDKETLLIEDIYDHNIINNNEHVRLLGREYC